MRLRHHSTGSRMVVGSVAGESSDLRQMTEALLYWLRDDSPKFVVSALNLRQMALS